MKRLLPFVFVFLTVLPALAQKRATNWYFGRNAGISFANNSVTSLNNGSQDAYEACASISDLNGNLLFYTDGLTIWTREHTVMTNGSGISGNRSATQGALIVPKPGSKSIYYLFTVDDTINNTFNLKYSVVDMTMENGLGAVTSDKNIQLISGISERMAATNTSGASGVWVVVRDADAAKFYSVLVNANGVATNPITTTIGSATSNSIGVQAGQMKFSPDGTYLAWACRSDRFVELLRFNKADGTFLNWSKKIDFQLANELPYGVEFAADASRLYVSLGFMGVYQFDMSMAVSESLLQDSKTKVSGNGVYGYGMQLASNGKIYVATFSSHIHVINYPAAVPAMVGFEASALSFSAGKFSRDGLPNFISNYFVEKRIVSADTCIGDSTSFSYLMELGDSILWNFGDPNSAQNISHLSQPKHVYGAAGKYTAMLIVFNGDGADTVYHTLTIHANPVFSLGADTIVCAGANYLLNPGVAFASYLWQDGKSTPVYAVKESGTYHVRVTSNSCVSYDTVVIRVDAPAVELLVSSEVNCVNNNAFNFSLKQQDRVALVSWKFGDGSESDGRQISHSYTRAGKFLVELETINENGCKAEMSTDVVVHDIIPAIAQIEDAEQCFDQHQFEVSFPDAANTGLKSYCIGFSDGKKFLNKPGVHTFQAPGEKSVHLITTTLEGCKDTSNSTLLVYATPAAGFDIDSSAYCLKNNIIKVTSTSGSLNGEILSTIFTSATMTAEGDQATFTYPNAGQYAITLEIEDNKGCKASSTNDIQIYPDPEVSFSIENDGNCLGKDQIDLKNESTLSQGIISAYLWDFGDGSSSTDFEPTKNYTEAKTYTITLTGISDKGCENTNSIQVVTYEAPKASFTTLNFSPCVNESRLDLDNTSSINSGDGLRYEWEIEGNTLTQTDIINYRFTTYGPKFVTLKVTSDKGCEDVYQTSFMVLPSPNVSFVIDEPFQCEDGNLFTALNTSDNPLSPVVGMEWELEDGRKFNGSKTDFSFTQHGTYSVKLSLLNLAGCEASALTQVIVHPQPVASFAADEVCQSQAVTFDNQSTIPTGSIQTAMWDFGDQQKAYSLSVSHKYDAPGEYAVYLEVSSDKGCTDFIVNKVRVNEEPKSEFTYKKYGYKSDVDETIYEFLSQETDPQARIDWYVNGIKRASGKKAYLGFNDTGHHHVTMTVSTGAGCPGTAHKEIFVAPPFELYMPTAFTPDGNGKNDILLPTTSSYIREYSMLIINRWGSVMFQSTDATQGWDGTFGGESVEPGVYIYIIKLKDIEGVEWNYQGSVLVLH